MYYSKAFDTISHRNLTIKMRGYGISPLTMKWIVDFLSNRKQRVKVNGQFSEWAICSSGIPQGSVLGPLLYQMYVNDLPEVIRHAIVKMNADDTKLCYSVNNVTDFNLLKADLDAVCAWSNKWLLKLHTKKCDVLRLKDVHIGDSYIINGVVLKFVDHVKDLGIYISKNLDFTYQCNYVGNFAYRKIHLIFRSFISRDASFMIKLFTVYVRPSLEYGSQIWSPFLLKNIDVVENVQRYFTRGIPGLARFSYPERLELLNVQYLELRRIRGDCIMLHKIF